MNDNLAYDTQGTIEEARRLWFALKRPNVLIKIPATNDGLLAIRQLISEGININITLLFGLRRYRQIIKAYITGINDRFDQGKPIKNIASVASFFLSRIDAVIDPKEEEEFVALGGEQVHFTIKICGRLPPFQALKLPMKFIKKHLKANSSLNWLIKVSCPSDCFWPAPALKIPNNRK